MVQIMLELPSSTANFTVAEHPDHPRLRYLVLSEETAAAFHQACGELNEQSLRYVPFLRFRAARRLRDLCDGLQAFLLQSLHDRDCGGVVLGTAGRATHPQACLLLATAAAHLIGLPNFDAMAAAYYARFAVRDEDDSDSYLRKAYRDMELHTDGTYVEEPTDWLIMMKSGERFAVGGRSRLLHLDQWEDLPRFRSHALAERPLFYQAPPSKNAPQPLRRPTFYERDGRPCIAFIDQFAQPETMEEAEFLDDLSSSLERSNACRLVELQVGEMAILNNHFWLHGREAFQQDSRLYRELIRLRGRFGEL